MLANKAGLTILSGNIQSIKAKFDELEAFINRVNTSNSISLVVSDETEHGFNIQCAFIYSDIMVNIR